MADKSNDDKSEIPTVVFDYIKATDFRSLRADGVIGGLTPNNHIHLAIYSERPAIPRRTVTELSDTGQLGATVEVESRNSIVREMSADLFLNLETAEALAGWLNQQIIELKKRTGQKDE